MVNLSILTPYTGNDKNTLLRIHLFSTIRMNIKLN